MKNFINFPQFCLLIFLMIFSTEFIYSSHWTTEIYDKKLLRFTYHEINQLLRKAQSESLTKYAHKKYKFFITDDEYLTIDGFTKKRSLDEIDINLISESLFLLFFHTDDDYYIPLKKIKDNGGVFYSLPFFGAKTKYVWTDKHALQSIDNAFSFGTRISHQNVDVHEVICMCLNATKDLPGDYVEVGVYKGGSALTALNYMKYSGISRKSYFLDTFDGMTYQEAYDSSDALWQNTHILWGVEDTIKHVDQLLKTTQQDFMLIPSNICSDSFPEMIQHIVVCNIDVDLYDATQAALTKIAPRIVKHGIIICEDPTSTPTLCGALLAMEEFLATSLGKKFLKLFVGAQYLLIKIHD